MSDVLLLFGLLGNVTKISIDVRRTCELIFGAPLTRSQTVCNVAYVTYDITESVRWVYGDVS